MTPTQKLLLALSLAANYATLAGVSILMTELGYISDAKGLLLTAVSFVIGGLAVYVVVGGE